MTQTNPPPDKGKDTRIKAWDRALWLKVLRNEKLPTANSVERHLSVLFQSIVKKKTNRLKIDSLGNGYWEHINDEDLAKWRVAMCAWGLGKKEVLPWFEDIEKIVLRTGIRIFTLYPDGPLPKIFTEGSQKRKDWLIKICDTLGKHQAWEKLGFKDLTPEQRFEQLKDIDYETLLNYGDELVRWKMAMLELQWKNKQVPRVARWLTRRGTIPPSKIQEWLQAWSTE
jgi:hypothetical protein